MGDKEAMKRHFALVAGLFCVVILLLASAVRTAAQPKFFIKEGTSFSFGEIPQILPVSHVVTIHNKGKKPLIISNISASCGCTGVMMAKEEIAPHDTGNLSITFNPKSYNGNVEKTVSFNTNDTANATVTIHFTATVLRIIEVDPEYIFIKSRVDSTSNESAIVRNVTNKPIQILSVTSTSKAIVPKLVRESLDPGEETKLKVAVTPEAAGAVGGTIEIRTDNPILPVLSVRVFSYVREH
jgi:hypothetical protein